MTENFEDIWYSSFAHCLIFLFQNLDCSMHTVGWFDVVIFAPLSSICLSMERSHVCVWGSGSLGTTRTRPIQPKTHPISPDSRYSLDRPKFKHQNTRLDIRKAERRGEKCSEATRHFWQDTTSHSTQDTQSIAPQPKTIVEQSYRLTLYRYVTLWFYNFWLVRESNQRLVASNFRAKQGLASTFTGGSTCFFWPGAQTKAAKKAVRLYPKATPSAFALPKHTALLQASKEEENPVARAPTEHEHEEDCPTLPLAMNRCAQAQARWSNRFHLNRLLPAWQNWSGSSSIFFWSRMLRLQPQIHVSHMLCISSASHIMHDISHRVHNNHRTQHFEQPKTSNMNTLSCCSGWIASGANKYPTGLQADHF